MKESLLAVVLFVASLWLCAVIGELFLPEDWRLEWYGFPLFMTGVSLCCGAFLVPYMIKPKEKSK